MRAHFTTVPFSILALADPLGQPGCPPGSRHVPNPGLQVAGGLGSAGPGLAGALQLALQRDPPGAR